MKRTLLAFLFVVLASAQSIAADGYRIQIKFTDFKDSLVFLAHYFGKPLPTIYKADSAKVDKKGIVTLESKEPIVGGIYIILLEDKARYFEFLLNNGDNITINATASNLPASLKYTNSPENERFVSYINYLGEFGKKSQALEEQLRNAKSKSDSNAIIEKGKPLAKELTTFRENYIVKYKGTLLANIFSALKSPEVPSGTHYLPDGTVDSNYAFYYYKAHFWDGFDFKDDRLIHTPLYDTRLDEYFNKMVLPNPDTVEKEANMLLAKTRGRKELFKYTLHWVTQWAQNSKVMGMDEVFVYMVENYHMKGDAYWMDNETLNKYIDRAQKIAPNVIGNLAPELKMVDTAGKPVSLSSISSKYTLLIFWAADCGHCQSEMPKIDSLYKAANLKKRGVTILAAKTNGDEDEKLWREFIRKNHLEYWINVYDPERKSAYKSQYDVYATPMIYLLDEKKIIRGKKIDHSNIATLLDMLDEKEKKTTKN